MSNDNCNCGNGHDHDEEFETITISLEGEGEIECNVLGIFDVEEKSYIALVPVDDDEVLIYGFKEGDGGTIELMDIESEEEYEKISVALHEIFEDIELEDDDDEDYDDEDYDEDDFDEDE